MGCPGWSHPTPLQGKQTIAWFSSVIEADVIYFFTKDTLTCHSRKCICVNSMNEGSIPFRFINESSPMLVYYLLRLRPLEFLQVYEITETNRFQNREEQSLF